MLKPSGGVLKKVFDPLGAGKKVGQGVSKVGGGIKKALPPANPVKAVKKVGGLFGKIGKKLF